LCRTCAATSAAAGRIIVRNGEGGLQKKKGAEPFTGGCAKNGTDADKFANAGFRAVPRAVLRAEVYAEVLAVTRADRFAEKNGTDANDLLILAQMSS
jgi:hypothetical protein